MSVTAEGILKYSDKGKAKFRPKTVYESPEGE